MRARFWRSTLPKKLQIDPRITPRSFLDDLAKIQKVNKNVVFYAPVVTRFLNFLRAVAAVGAENLTQQSSNTP